MWMFDYINKSEWVEESRGEDTIGYNSIIWHITPCINNLQSTMCTVYKHFLCILYILYWITVHVYNLTGYWRKTIGWTMNIEHVGKSRVKWILDTGYLMLDSHCHCNCHSQVDLGFPQIYFIPLTYRLCMLYVVSCMLYAVCSLFSALDSRFSILHPAVWLWYRTGCNLWAV